ncbi:radical SAM protein [Roseovarius sp. LXJ103]|uniref:radical SAM protein n=1 Tax=Roseovarius carneus TaxID=2853164 RepID=UPI000D616E67|nr:radical SAM protein [Roseovarius carneus]MBZ8119884.1 radical SAM protein [Roseovarius carneus]PWE34526.1 radical SAM protein [Pelagicola sp. LXJ1103]
MVRTIPFQDNLASIVALLPDGQVDFFHPQLADIIHEINAGAIDANTVDFEAYRLSEPWVEMDQFHLSAPAIAFVEITNLCNLTCDHCYAWSGPKRQAEISTDEILQLLDTFEEMGVLQVFLTGGEVFAHKDAVKIIRHARTKSFSTQIFTNGTLITAEKLAAIPPGQSFFISFDTAHPERTIRGKMNFPKLRDIYGWMKDHGHVLRTAISVHRQNIDDVEEIFDWCADNDFPRPQWLETHPIGRALLNPHIQLEREDIDRVFGIYERCMDRYQLSPEEAEAARAPAARDMSGEPKSLTPEPEIRGVETIKFCQRLERATNQEKCGRSVVYVTSQGKVYPCSNCMSNDIHQAASITEKAFKRIWEEDFGPFRDITFDDYDACNTCAVKQAGIWCQFRCPPLAQNVSKSQTGCGATEYLREFMLRSNAYWDARRRDGYKLSLSAAPRQDAPSQQGTTAHAENV